MLPSSWTGLAVSLLLFCSPSFAAPTDIPSAASFYIPSIPHVHQRPDERLLMYGGHLPSTPNPSRDPKDISPHLYFFMVKNRRKADKERLIFWFNGGPGCSSFDGAMMEVGPWRWDGKSEHDFFTKDGGWNEYSTIVFIDQPAGTGFSYTSTDSYLHEIKDVQAHLIEFYKNFYAVFPELLAVDTYLAGESFGGQWIPYFADAILSSNVKIPLKGIAIGNGWIDSRHQYPTYIDFALKTGLIEDNTAQYKIVKGLTDDCLALLEKTKGNPMGIKKCQRIIHGIMDSRDRTVNGTAMCINIYDIRLEDTKPACGMNWPPEMPAITKFLGRPEVVSALHANAHPGPWTECKPGVHRAFREYDTDASVTVFPRLLEKIKILIFAGDQDLICNYMGLENMIKHLNWNGHTGLGTVQTESWNVNGQPAGTWVESRGLTYVKMFNASHMAPFDSPEAAHDMMLRFMGVNFTAIVDGTARIPSSIGAHVKPVFVEQHEAKNETPSPAKSPQQDKAMWEAYYNAGSAALVLVLVFVVIGTFVWCRVRRKRAVALPMNGSGPGEESIPLNSAMRREQELEEEDAVRQRKGKGRDGGIAVNGGTSQRNDEAIFEVGDSDDEDYKHKK